MDEEEREKKKEGEGKEKEGQEKYKVLEVFGLELKVSNPRLAKLLTMEAKDVLTTDIRELGDKIRKAEAAVEKEGISSLSEISSLESYHQAVDFLGRSLDFEIDLKGIWRSSTGIFLLIHPVFGKVTFERAKEYVIELGEKIEDFGDVSAGLFVVTDKLACDIFKAAIREENRYHQIRVISYENLAAISAFKEGKVLTHKQVVSLLVPLVEIDVGELIDVIKAISSSHRKPLG